MTTLTFKEYLLLNTDVISGESNSKAFTVKTKYAFQGPKLTTLIRGESKSAEKSHTNQAGVIDWKEKTFEVEGVKKPLADLIQEPKKVFRVTREWQWSDRTYTVVFGNDKWTATRGDDASAVLTMRKVKSLIKDDPATMTFSDACKEDIVFLVLVLLWSETQRANKRPSAGEAVGEAAGGVAGTIAGNALASCCSIQ